MLCENCGKREANVRYSENINGVKKEMHLCEECSRKLGIAQDMDFKIPALDFSNFFGSFLEDFNTPDFMPLLNEVKQLKCDSCGSTFEDIIDTGRYGCPNCYDVFEDRMDPILKNLQGANRHVGRLGKISNNNLKFQDKESKKEKKEEIHKILMEDKQIPELPYKIQHVSYMDGSKVYFENGGWVIGRFSGTEPLIRIFCEMPTKEQAIEVCEIYEKFLGLK